MSNEIHCPKCGSNQLHADRKGFSGKKAIAGAVLTGGVGLLAGTIGSNKIKITCLACGRTFKPGEGAVQIDNSNVQVTDQHDKVYQNLCLGNIKRFIDIFDYIPMEVVAIDVGISNQTLNRRFDNLENITMKEIFELSSRINSSIETYNLIVKLIIDDWQKSGGEIKNPGS